MAYEKIGRSAWAVFCCLVSGGGLCLAPFFLPHFSCPIFLALFFLGVNLGESFPFWLCSAVSATYIAGSISPKF